MLLSLIPRKYIIIAAIVAVLGALLWFWRADIYRQAQNAIANQITQNTLRIVEERNEIANNRPTDSRTIERLRDGTF